MNMGWRWSLFANPQLTAVGLIKIPNYFALCGFKSTPEE
jgi:hypothetical protein